MSPVKTNPNLSNYRPVTRKVRLGGMSKRGLLLELQKQGIQINKAGKTLFASDTFTTSEVSSILETVEISVADLGCVHGAVINRVHERAFDLGLSLCPIEVGPHLRLQFLDQPEGHMGHAPSQHRAPPGSITVASLQLMEDEDFPKGFYLRRIEGVLWLRGYCSGPEHIWSPQDKFVFCRPQNVA